MNDLVKRSVRHALSSVALLLLLVAGAPAAHAQITFGTQLSDRGREAVTDPDRMDAERLLGLLAEEGQFVYKGEKPATAKLIVFFSDGEGKMRERMEGKPFRLEPGVHPAGKHFPSDIFLALFEKAFPDTLFFPDGYFFPDSTFDSEKRFPDTLFDEMGLKGDQAGLVLALVPAEEMREEAQSRPMGLVLSLAR